MKGSSKSPNKTKLSKEDVLHLAHLVRLQLTDEEIDTLTDQLGETISYIKNLEELDTSGVKETSHTVNSNNVSFEDGTPPTRTLSQEKALQNAPKKKDGFFIVSKILDK